MKRVISAKWLTASVLILFCCGVLWVLFSSHKFVYRLDTEATLFGVKEWELLRTIDGNLITVERNHEKGLVDQYGVTEFQRGDVVHFMIHPTLQYQSEVKAGDTIGFVYSNEEQRRLKELEGQYEVLKSEYQFHTTGQKPEDELLSRRELSMAQQALTTQQKLLERSEWLFRDSVISLQQYELDVNEYRIKELAVKVAEARLASVTTGEKVEQALWIASRMSLIEGQIAQIRERLSFFTVLSPINGTLIRQWADKEEVLVKIVDFSSYVVRIGVRSAERHLFEQGSRFVLSNYSDSGSIISVGNVEHRSINGHQIYLTEVLSGKDNPYIYGHQTAVRIYGKPLNVRQFIYVMFTLKTPV
jgi:hypothetical protein